MCRYKPLDITKKVLITGAAGFIGYHLSKRLLEAGVNVVGADNLYCSPDVGLRLKRADLLKKNYPNFCFEISNIETYSSIERVFMKYRPNIVVNLAGKAGVRQSTENPRAHLETNVMGFFNVLEACKNFPVEHLLYASSSSVYGNQEKTPYSTTDRVDSPISFYAVTKKMDEIMAFNYSHMHGIPTTGLRFFTVYGPWGRPDMSYFKWADLIREGKPIDIYNYGEMLRDFTYIDDIVEGITRMLCNPPAGETPYKIYNIGNGTPIPLMTFIETFEKALGKTAEKNYLPMQAGDVYQTYADTKDLEKDFDFRPHTSIEYGLQQFADWYWKYSEERERKEEKERE